jgi:hypothetical protein
MALGRKAAPVFIPKNPVTKVAGIISAVSTESR